MNVHHSLSDPRRRYNAELRLFIVSTSPKTAPERSALIRTVLPEIRQRAAERGVIVTEVDPRWEMASEPGRAREILAARTNEMLAYRPVFIGILGGDPPASGMQGPPLPWLADRLDAPDRMMAMELIERVLDNDLMRGRAFFYLPDPQTPPSDDSESARKLEELRGRLLSSHFPARQVTEGIEALCARILEDLLTALDASAREIDETLPEALARLDERILASRKVVAGAKPELLALVTAAESTHDAIEAIADVVGQQRDTLAKTQASLLETLATGGEQAQQLGGIVDDTIETTRRFAESAAPQLVDIEGAPGAQHVQGGKLCCVDQRAFSLGAQSSVALDRPDGAERHGTRVDPDRRSSELISPLRKSHDAVRGQYAPVALDVIRSRWHAAVENPPSTQGVDPLAGDVRIGQDVL